MLLVAGFLSVGVAHARAADPYVVYTANKFVNGAAVLRIDPVTGAAVEISRNGPQGNLLRHPYDVAVERDGSLLVADMGEQNQKDGAVIRIAPFTGRQQLVSNGSDFYDPAGIALAPDGTIYVVDSFPGAGGGAVIRVDPVTGAQQLISSNFNPLALFHLSFGIAMDRDGSLVVVNRSVGGDLQVGCGLAGSVMRVDPANGSQTPLAGLLSFPNVFLSYPVGVAIEPGGGVIVANECPGGAGLVRVGAAGAQTRVTGNDSQDLLRTPERVAVAPGGDLLVTDYNGGADNDGGVVRVDPATGAQTPLASGPLFNHPLGIATVANRPPVAALAASAVLVGAGRQVDLDAAGSRDPEGLRLVFEWDLDGDGDFETASGTTTKAMTRWTRGGTHVVRVRVNDPHGGRAVAERRIQVDGSRPVLSSLRVGSLDLSRRRSTTLRFALSEPATVDLAIDRGRRGRRPLGARVCSAGARRGRRCLAWTRARHVRRAATAGRNGIALRARRLRPGRYRVVLTATDAVGNVSLRRTLGLRIVR